VRRAARYESGSGFDGSRLAADLLESERIAAWGLDPGTVRVACARATSLADGVRRLYGLAAAAAGKPRAGDKTPIYVLHLDELTALLPEARVVHVIRDGRDVTLSWLDGRWGPRTVVEAALVWRLRVERGQRSGRRLGPDRYHEVRYEDLLEDPKRVTDRLCQFLELDPDPAVLRYFERGAEVAATMRRPEYHKGLSLPPTKGLRDWATTMSDRDVAVFQVLAGDLLGALGYPPSPTPPGAAAWGRAQAGRLRWQLGRVRAAIRRRAGGGDPR
jgi:hypothetical protein